MPAEFVIKSDGRILRRPFEVTCAEEREIQIDDAITSSISLTVSRSARNMFGTPDGYVGAALVKDTNLAYLSMRLSTLQLNATIATSDDLVIPSFKDVGDYVTLQWKPPTDMKLIFTARMEWTGSVWQSTFEYLFAFATATEVYRLPLPNVYNDCHICDGRHGDPYSAPTMFECFQRAFYDIKSSKWNGDLINDSTHGMYAESQQLFRFKPTTAGFDTVLPDDVHWTKLCRKVGTDVLNHVVI